MHLFRFNAAVSASPSLPAKILRWEFVTLSPPQLLPVHHLMAGISADGLHGNLPPLWPRRCMKLAHGRILSHCSLLSFAFLSSLTEFTRLKSPVQLVLSILNTLPHFLEAPFPHHSHGANSQHLKTRSTASSGTCYFTCTCPSPSFLPLLSTPLLLEVPPVSAAVPLTQMYLCAAFPDFHLGCSASQHPEEHGGDFYLTPQCQDSCLSFPQ